MASVRWANLSSPVLSAQGARVPHAGRHAAAGGCAPRRAGRRHAARAAGHRLVRNHGRAAPGAPADRLRRCPPGGGPDLAHRTCPAGRRAWAPVASAGWVVASAWTLSSRNEDRCPSFFLRAIQHTGMAVIDCYVCYEGWVMLKNLTLPLHDRPPRCEVKTHQRPAPPWRSPTWCSRPSSATRTAATSTCVQARVSAQAGQQCWISGGKTVLDRALPHPGTIIAPAHARHGGRCAPVTPGQPWP